MDWLRSQTKLFRATLYCYPAEFRREYGAEMEQVFHDRLRSEPRWRLWLDTLADTAFSAPKEHADILLGDLKYGSRVLAATPGFSAIVLLVIARGMGAVRPSAGAHVSLEPESKFQGCAGRNGPHSGRFLWLATAESQFLHYGAAESTTLRLSLLSTTHTVVPSAAPPTASLASPEVNPQTACAP